MIKVNNNWFYYKKVLQWFFYVSLTIVGIFLLYLAIEYFFEKTFASRGVKYESYQGVYTSEPGTEAGPIDKSKWKRESVDRGWSVPVFIHGYIHPLVAFTISFIIAIAIIGGIIVFRSQTKHTRR